MTPSPERPMAEPLTPEEEADLRDWVWTEHPVGAPEDTARLLDTLDRERLRADAATVRVERLEGALRRIAARPSHSEARDIAREALQDIPAPEPRTEDEFRERPCPACGAALAPADTHWNLMTDAYECPPPSAEYARPSQPSGSIRTPSRPSTSTSPEAQAETPED